MATLQSLPRSPRTTVFRVIDNTLRRDSVLRSAIKPSSFRSWTGNTKDDAPFEISMAPALRLTPMNGPEEFAYPNAMRGWLFIACEMLVKGYDADDIMNLWWALELALYKQGVPQALQQAGAFSGLALFSQPAFDPDPKDQQFHAIGQIKIEVLLKITGPSNG